MHQERHFHLLKFNYVNRYILKKNPQNKTKQKPQKEYLCVKGSQWLILFKRQEAFISALAKRDILRKTAETVPYIIHVWLTEVHTGHTFTAISDMKIGSRFLISDPARNASSRSHSWFSAPSMAPNVPSGQNTTPLSHRTGSICCSRTSEPVKQGTFVVVVSISTSLFPAGGEASNVKEHAGLLFHAC